jgi:hypothetical protein
VVSKSRKECVHFFLNDKGEIVEQENLIKNSVIYLNGGLIQMDFWFLSYPNKGSIAEH